MALQTQPNNQMKASAAAFSKREKEVIAMIAEGLSTKIIAQKCYLSSDTVATHRKNIIRKINAVNTASAVARAFRIGLLN